MAMRSGILSNMQFRFSALFRRMQKTLANELENKKDKQSKIEQWNDSVIDLWKRLEAHITIKHPEDTTAPIPIQAVNIAPAPPIPGLCMLYF